MASDLIERAMMRVAELEWSAGINDKDDPPRALGQRESASLIRDLAASMERRGQLALELGQENDALRDKLVAAEKTATENALKIAFAEMMFVTMQPTDKSLRACIKELETTRAIASRFYDGEHTPALLADMQQVTRELSE